MVSGEIPRTWGSPILSTPPTLPLLACFLLFVQCLVLVLSRHLQGPQEILPRVGAVSHLVLS